MAAIVTLTTDFGEGSPYVGQLKGAILSVAADATIVDVTHSVPPQNIRRGALVLRDIVHRFPAGTVHVAVIDPGVGTERDLLAARVGHVWLIAPDNGLLTLAAIPPRTTQVIRLTNRRYWAADVSATFHGRDIMAPVAAHLALSQSLDGLGEPVADITRLDFPVLERSGTALRGAVLLVDTFGNAITNIPAEALPPIPPDDLQICCRSAQLHGLVRTYHDRASGTPVTLVGSSGYLEIAVVNGDAAEGLGIAEGDPVEIRWPDRPPAL
jgi:S-adenosylmethionine hydrolase